MKKYLAILISITLPFSAFTEPAYDVIIIGAGVSGLGAAQELQKSGKKILVLEARGRIGGRIWTYLDDNTATDLGASWIHGITNNPIHALTQQYSIETLQTKSSFDTSTLHGSFAYGATYDSDGKHVNPEAYLKLAKEFDSFCKKYQQETSLKQAIDDFTQLHPDQSEKIANISHILATGVGADPQALSLSLGTDVLSNISGPDVIFPNGYIQIIENLSKNIPIHLNEPVTTIKYRIDGVEVVTKNGSYQGNFAICTLPLGVLKSESVQFDPPLPEKKKLAIQRIGCGVYNKVYMRFDHVFWDKDKEGITIFPKYEFMNQYPFCQKPILVGFVGGSLAKQVESWSDTQVINDVMAELKKVYGPNIPQPVHYVITRWNKDPYTKGSYSFAQIGSSLEDYKMLKEPLENKLYFAGEATSLEDSMKVDGAYSSGVEAAREIIVHEEHNIHP